MMHKPLSSQAAMHYAETWNEELSRHKKYKEATQKRTREMQLRNALKNPSLHYKEQPQADRIR